MCIRDSHHAAHHPHHTPPPQSHQMNMNGHPTQNYGMFHPSVSVEGPTMMMAPHHHLGGGVPMGFEPRRDFMGYQQNFKGMFVGGGVGAPTGTGSATPSGFGVGVAGTGNGGFFPGDAGDVRGGVNFCGEEFWKNYQREDLQSFWQFWELINQSISLSLCLSVSQPRFGRL
eukprot:TRINITY_DN6283_c0_g1_i3.p1 TRINITY_DN6283_c0_g1~~TRINITY_DN6283_c0_g1_i3.p1  ORF type:complete len:201 (-),score=36.75 TRINITY_DN6283_c0_g1_i3:134-646(-)